MTDFITLPKEQFEGVLIAVRDLVKETGQKVSKNEMASSDWHKLRRIDIDLEVLAVAAGIRTCSHPSKCKNKAEYPTTLGIHFCKKHWQQMQNGKCGD